MEALEVRPIGPALSNRIVRFRPTRFPRFEGGFNTFVLPRLLMGPIAVFLIGTAIPFSTPTYAQSQIPISDLGRQQAVSGDSQSPEVRLVTIYNPRNQAIPVSEAKTIYLSACKVVEQEFSRTDPVRPKVRLFLGSDANRVYYPKREIQLTKWDKFKFAEGVVILATDSLLPEEKKYSLSKLALVEAEGVVDVHELKDGAMPLIAGPRN